MTTFCIILLNLLGIQWDNVYGMFRTEPNKYSIRCSILDICVCLHGDLSLNHMYALRNNSHWNNKGVHGALLPWWERELRLSSAKAADKNTLAFGFSAQTCTCEAQCSARQFLLATSCFLETFPHQNPNVWPVLLQAAQSPAYRGAVIHFPSLQIRVAEAWVGLLFLHKSPHCCCGLPYSPASGWTPDPVTY